jgi:hypothetical protein
MVLGTLQSRRPRTGLNEQSWRVVSCWLLRRLAVGCQVSAGENPRRFSAAQARRAVRKVSEWMRQGGRGKSLTTRWREAAQDSNRRGGLKASRDWPHKKNGRPPKPPKTRPAQPAKTAKAEQLGFVVHLVS